MHIHSPTLGLKELIMFLIKAENAENPSRELTVMYSKLKKNFGEVPPHFKLLGMIDPDILRDTLSYLNKIMNHPTISADLFAFIRLYVANREGYEYCINFNTNLLKKRDYQEIDILRAKENFSLIPFDKNEKILASKAIKAIYNPHDFNKEDLNELYELGWSNKDIFDAIDHAGFLLKNGRIISCYMDRGTS